MESATNKVCKFAPNRSEAGVALLIAMFAVLLVSLAAISLILSAGTESSLAGNYRSSASAYYAASAGLEEARGRLLSKNPDFFNNTVANFIPTAGTPLLAVGQVRYVTNPVAAENVLAIYPDIQYDTEFGAGSLAAATGAGNVNTIPSVSTVTSGWRRRGKQWRDSSLLRPRAFGRWRQSRPKSHCLRGSARHRISGFRGHFLGRSSQRQPEAIAIRGDPGTLKSELSLGTDAQQQ